MAKDRYKIIRKYQYLLFNFLKDLEDPERPRKTIRKSILFYLVYDHNQVLGLGLIPKLTNRNHQFFQAMYCTHTIINRGLYILNPLVEGLKQFLKEVLPEISAFMYGLYSRAVSNQEQVMMACTVLQINLHSQVFEGFQFCW